MPRNFFTLMFISAVFGFITGCFYDTNPVEVPNPIVVPHLKIEPRVASLRPGESIRFAVGEWKCCVFFEPVMVATEWNIEPQEAGAIIKDGTFTLSKVALPGDRVLIQAKVDMTSQLEALVAVYTDEFNPLVGTWREERQIMCDGQEQNPDEPFQELVFRADGRFTLTWHPFEVYTDYVGTYVYDAVTLALLLHIDGGNYVPEQTDLEGTIVVQSKDQIRLENIFLGIRSPSKTQANVCGHIIGR